MELRDYQQAAVEAVYGHLRERDDNGEMANVVKGFAKREAPASTPRAAAGGAPWKR